MYFNRLTALLSQPVLIVVVVLWTWCSAVGVPFIERTFAYGKSYRYKPLKMYSLAWD